MVIGYTGRPGSGKTSTMVQRAHKAKQMGKRILSNIPLIDNRERTVKRYWFFGESMRGPVNPATFGNSWSDGMVTSIDEIIREDNAVILLDEVHMWLSSDRWKEISWEVRQFLAQQRKEGIDVWWTAQSAGRVFNVIRELTATAWHCTRYGPLTQLIGTDPETKESMGKTWLLQQPGVWDLYNTRFKVGDGAGKAGTYGNNARYDRRPGQAPPGAAGKGAAVVPVAKRLPAYATLERIEAPDGSVKYVRSAALREWWASHDRGEEKGPSPIACKPPQVAQAGEVPSPYPEDFTLQAILGYVTTCGSTIGGQIGPPGLVAVGESGRGPASHVPELRPDR